VHDAYGEPLPNADFLKEHFFHEGRLTEAQALYILQQATTLLSGEPNLVNVESPVTSECALGSKVGV
jgi:serine/threonine-protein phosphatase 2B catalytic subunit